MRVLTKSNEDPWTKWMNSLDQAIKELEELKGENNMNLDLNTWFRTSSNITSTGVEAKELEENYKVFIPAPGYKKEEIRITFIDALLTIDMEPKECKEREYKLNSKYVKLQVTAPDLNREKMEAKLEEGYLTITFGRDRNYKKNILIQ